MYKLKLSFVLILVMISGIVTAQSLQEGKKFLYQQRFASAKTTMEKVVAAAPTNPESIYWLAQVHFEMKDVNGAKEVLRKGMEGANGSNPLLLVAMGQAELVDKKPNDARQRFETAISLTKGKDVAVFAAIGKANLEEGGDAAYGIEKLKQGKNVKGFKDAMTFVYMGDLYRKLMDGGGAQSSYENAITIDQKLAIAKYKIGKIYITQGSEQKDIYLGRFNDAINDDTAFTPALYDLYSHYYSRDINKATEFFRRYRSHTDPGPALDYEEAGLHYAAGNFKDAITKADNLLSSQGEKADPRLHKLRGYCYDKLGDSVQALAEIETFFQKAKTDQIVPDNYVFAATNAAKTKADPQKVNNYFQKAIEADSVLVNKIDLAKKAADFFKKSGQLQLASEWFVKVLTMKSKPSNVDYYNAGLAYYNTKEFLLSDSLFTLYKVNYPKENVGYLWSFRSKQNIDTSMVMGLAVPTAIELIAILDLDKVKFKSQIIEASSFLANYYANIKSDYAASILWFDKILEVDIANADAIKYKEILTKRLSAIKK